MLAFVEKLTQPYFLSTGQILHKPLVSLGKKWTKFIIFPAAPELLFGLHIEYIFPSMPIDWNSEKNDDLKKRYGFGFERVVTALGEDSVLEDRAHPNSKRYGHQRQMIVRIENYAWVVPYVQAGEDIFLKTMFPSRKATKRHLEPKS